MLLVAAHPLRDFRSRLQLIKWVEPWRAARDQRSRSAPHSGAVTGTAARTTL